MVILSLGLSPYPHCCSSDGLAPLSLILNVGRYRIHNRVPLTLQIPVERPNLRRGLLRSWKEGCEFLRCDDGWQLGWSEKEAVQDG